MFKNYIKISLRSLKTNKLSSFINIAGLAAGMAITVLIGLWVYDEVNFDKYHTHYDRIGQLWQFVKFDVVKSSYNSLPQPLAAELRQKYPEFKKVTLTTFNKDATFAYEDILLTLKGMYVEPVFPEMMTFRMIKGNQNALSDPGSILISASMSKKIFKDSDPLNQIIKVNNKDNLKVAGVYEDLPQSSSFYDVQYLAPWANYISNDDYAKRAVNAWDENSWPIYVELQDKADYTKVSSSIKDIRMKLANPPGYKPEFFVHPMAKWHLQGEFYDGQISGGLMQLVRMFGIVGIFILLLACVNFMNLSTARSEKRAKEVGIRKTIGSLKSQLIGQFYMESGLMAFLALIVSIALVFLLLPLFNGIAAKHMQLPYSNPWFWTLLLAFTVCTALIAGSYPAFYLSKFEPIKVLKGSFKMGSFASVSRKSLVVFQYVVSIILIIATWVVYRQINFAKERSLGYNNAGLVEVKMLNKDLYRQYEALRNELIQSGSVQNVSASMGGLTEEFGGTTNINWKGKPTDQKPLFILSRATHDFGNTIGWEVVQGRDFSRTFSMDSASVIINQAALKTMNLKDPLNESIGLGGKKYQIIGVVNDILKFDPFQPVKPYVFILDYYSMTTINLKLSPGVSTKEDLAKVGAVFKKYNPTVPFEYSFVDEDYAQKFATQMRIGKLSAIFSVLAIFISCLGLFGLASFMAEKRTKEIGVRKVLGATVFKVWTLLSKDFIILSIISLSIAIPISYYLMTKWLATYSLRVSLSLDIFLMTAMGIIIITLLTISTQSIRAAIANPVKSLRSE